MTALRLGVLCDYPEEGWPSMDLAAEMLLKGLQSHHACDIAVTRIVPAFRRPFGFLGGPGRNADRLLNRLSSYPRHLRRRARDFDAFHLVDHSYAQLLHEIPPGRAGVFCHDLDTFRCLLTPGQEPRPKWFRAMAGRILRGFQKAAVVFYATKAVRRQIEQHGLIDPARLVHAPLGTAPEFTVDAVGTMGGRGSRRSDRPSLTETPARQEPRPPEGEDDASFHPRLKNARYLLHVGSCIPRKRIDFLLDVFAAVRQQDPNLLLAKVGGPFTPDQRQQMDRLGLNDSIVQFQDLTRAAIAALYRHAALVLQPSDAEGFGLPIVEALACGAPVVASDIPVLREVGGDAALYCPVGDLRAWAQTIRQSLERPELLPAQSVRLSCARLYSWENHCRTIAQTYRRLFAV